MTRVMIDTTHNGLAAALPVIKTLPAGNLVALYDTGTPGIPASPGDIAEIPSNLVKVFIDQGFTGSPNMSATVRDCENGAWSISNAVNKTGWNVDRPTLYLGFPDTAIQAAQAGWKGDVWLVHSASAPPTTPPMVPSGLNVVGVQWNFQNLNFDVTIVFDPTWPAKAAVPVTPPTTATLLGIVAYIQENFRANVFDFESKRVTSTDGGRTWSLSRCYRDSRVGLLPPAHPGW